MAEKILVYDVEKACWMGHPPEGMRHDIIEIGFCVLDVRSKIISEKRSLLIKPANAKVDWFCKKLTGLTQERLDAEGMGFSEACGVLVDEVGSRHIPSASWGMDDGRAIRRDCQFYGVEYPFGKEHVNAQNRFRSMMGTKDFSSMEKALAHFGLSFEGVKHSGVDDAYNAARILAQLL